jgi:hypothetical protein
MNQYVFGFYCLAGIAVTILLTRFWGQVSRDASTDLEADESLRAAQELTRQFKAVGPGNGFGWAAWHVGGNVVIVQYEDGELWVQRTRDNKGRRHIRGYPAHRVDAAIARARKAVHHAGLWERMFS